jgi:phosphoribosylamine--glycine ligase
VTRIAIIDTELAGLDFALRCLADDHEVMLFQQTAHPIGRGFPGLKRSSDLEATMRWVGRDGLVVPTGNAKFVRDLERWRDMGWKVFGPTPQSAALEIDRARGMAAMKACGIELPHYETFDSLEAAEKFARKSDKAYVFKPLGSEENKALTYVSSDPADLVGWIQRQMKRGMRVSSCMLQEKIDMVCEFGVSGWFGPEGFLPDKWQECFEFKKQLVGDLGQSTGEEGTVTAYTSKSRLASEMLEPMAPVLATLGHRGDFAIGCGIDATGRAWPFEYTARSGWPAWYNQTASHKGDVAKWMVDLMTGKDSLRVSTDPCVSVVCSQPPYPKFDGAPACTEGVPISGLDEVWDQVHPIMMQIASGPTMEQGRVVTRPQHQSAGEMLFVMTGLGGTVESARETVYGALKGVSYSDKQWRKDIGARLETQLPELHALGWAEDIEW